MNRRLNPAVKFILIALIFGGLFFAFIKFKDKIIPEGRQAKSILTEEVKQAKKDGIKVYTIAINTWSGFAGGLLFNNGFEASKDSEFFKKYGFMVQFKVMDDLKPSRDAFSEGSVDVLWMTYDSIPVEADALAKMGAKAPFQIDWSRGGDVAVATKDIKSIEDLKGQPVAFAMGAPSNSYLLTLLKAAGKDWSYIKPIPVDSALIAVKYFLEGKVKMAIVWSPDDMDCLEKVPGSHVFGSTKTHTNVIADGFVIKDSTITKNKEDMTNLYRGWMIGNGMINTDANAKAKAVKIMAVGFNMKEDFFASGVERVRLTTHGDNLNFFGLNAGFSGVTGDELYTKMSQMYEAIGYSKNAPSWRQISTTSLIIAATDLNGDRTQNAEGKFKFTAPTAEMNDSQALASKAVRVTFPTGSANLDENGKIIIQTAVGDVLKNLAGSRVRIEGHTDNVGNAESNRALSKRRANSVASYLVEKYGYDRNRFVVTGKGQDMPIASNNTDDGRSQNRRTEVEILN